MKKFKDIRNITESHDEPGVGSTLQGRYQVDKKDPEVISRIEQAINHELKKGYMSPSTAINQLRTKLNFVGFDFDLKDVPSSGKLTLPLKMATETFGKKIDTPFDEFEKDDSSVGLTLTLDISKNSNGLYILNGSIK